MTSYDVKVLFTSVPMDPSINIVKQKLQQDPLLTKDQHVYATSSQTPKVLPQKHLLLIQGKDYEQVHGAAMGSPLAPLIANLFMEEFEVKALSSSPHPHAYG